MSLFVFFTLLKVCTETIKIANIIQKKSTDRITLAFYQNHEKTWILHPVFTILLTVSWKCKLQAALISDQISFRCYLGFYRNKFLKFVDSPKIKKTNILRTIFYSNKKIIH